MPVGTWQKFEPFVQAVHHKLHNLQTDIIYGQLLNVAPSGTCAVETDLPADIAGTNLYTTGGFSLGSASISAQTTGTYKFGLSDKIFTAGTGQVGTFRYVVLLNNTATNKDLIGFYDYGQGVVLQSGETLTIDFDGSNGIFQSI